MSGHRLLLGCHASQQRRWTRTQKRCPGWQLFPPSANETCGKARWPREIVAFTHQAAWERRYRRGTFFYSLSAAIRIFNFILKIADQTINAHNLAVKG